MIELVSRTVKLYPSLIPHPRWRFPLSKSVIAAFPRCAHFGKSSFNPTCRCSDCRRKAWNDKTKKEKAESIQTAITEQKRRAELNKIDNKAG